MNRAVVLAAALWMAMHLGFALLFFDRHPMPVLDLIALVLLFGATGWACAPLITGRVALGSVEASLLVLAGAVSVASVVPLSGTDLTTVASWVLGALNPLIAALAMRRQPKWAAALALASCFASSGSVWRNDLPISWYFVMCYPPLLWLAGALFVRRIFDTSEAVRIGYDQVAGQEAHQAELTKVREQVAAARRAELRLEVSPMLERLAAGVTLSATDRQACGELAAGLRDDLRARTVLTIGLRTMLHEARQAGTRVVVLDDRDSPIDDEVAESARNLIEQSLVQLTGADLTYRISADGTAITLVAQGAPRVIALAAERLQPIRNLTLQVDDDLLYVELI